MKNEIFEILNKVGVPCNLSGRRYLETALEIVLEKGVVPMTKTLYPEIASKHGMTATRVERAIRHAIETVFLNTDDKVLFEVFGNTIKVKSGKLANSEFIYGVRSYLEAQSRYKKF